MKAGLLSSLVIKLLTLIFVGFSLLSTEIVLAATSPEMAYPQNGQTLDLEGGYMFKVKTVEGASGYLLKLYQSGQTVYETESSNGEFGIWEDNPAHAKFHTGEVQAVIKAQVGGSWTDEKAITITLRSRKSSSDITLTAPQPSPIASALASPIPNTSPNPSATAQPSPISTPIPSQLPAASPTSNPTPSFAPSPTPIVSTNNYQVKAYLVYPADKVMYPEYESAVRSYLAQLQNWYKQKIGVTFTLAPLQIIRSGENYLTMRCGANPSSACINDPARLDGNVGAYVNKAIHQGVENWDQQTATLVFAAGAGGYAGANKYPNDTGFAIVGDWVLEPISGKTNEWGISCNYSGGWQCGMGVAKGTPAHELGHAFGLGHPDPSQYSGGHSIMIWHGDYPTYGFLPYEVEYLNNSPFFQSSNMLQTPILDVTNTPTSTNAATINNTENTNQTPNTNNTSIITTIEGIVNQVISLLNTI